MNLIKILGAIIVIAIIFLKFKKGPFKVLLIGFLFGVFLSDLVMFVGSVVGLPLPIWIFRPGQPSIFFPGNVVEDTMNGIWYAFIFWIIYTLVRKIENKKTIPTP